LRQSARAALDVVAVVAVAAVAVLVGLRLNN